MSNAKKKSFILFNDLKGTIDDLDDAEAANLLRAIFEYQQEGNVDSFDKLTKLLMKPIILQFKRDAENGRPEVREAERMELSQKGALETQWVILKPRITQANPENLIVLL